MGDSARPLCPVMLRPSDPAYSERLLAFMESLGVKGAVTEEEAVALERDIPAPELSVYLRVWSVLYPEVTVSVDRTGADRDR